MYVPTNPEPVTIGTENEECGMMNDENGAGDDNGEKALLFAVSCIRADN